MALLFTRPITPTLEKAILLTWSAFAQTLVRTVRCALKNGVAHLKASAADEDKGSFGGTWIVVSSSHPTMGAVASTFEEVLSANERIKGRYYSAIDDVWDAIPTRFCDTDWQKLRRTPAQCSRDRKPTTTQKLGAEQRRSTE